MSCRRCGGEHSVTKSNKRYCRKCERYRRKMREIGTPVSAESPMSYQQIADELWMRGFPTSKEWVRKLENRVLVLMRDELSVFDQGGV